MENNVQLFDNPEFGEVRVVTINGEPWLVGKDVAIALGYVKPTDAVRNHVPDKFKGVSEMETPGGKQNVVVINEAGMYKLVMRSKLENAEKFSDWVCEEVLPSIRKTVGYSVDGEQTEKSKIRWERLNLQRGIELRKTAKAVKDPNVKQALLVEAANLIAGKEILAESPFYEPELIYKPKTRGR